LPSLFHWRINASWEMSMIESRFSGPGETTKKRTAFLGKSLNDLQMFVRSAGGVSDDVPERHRFTQSPVLTDLGNRSKQRLTRLLPFLVGRNRSTNNLDWLLVVAWQVADLPYQKKMVWGGCP
jgi:hypothetical protein